MSSKETPYVPLQEYTKYGSMESAGRIYSVYKIVGLFSFGPYMREIKDKLGLPRPPFSCKIIYFKLVSRYGYNPHVAASHTHKSQK